MKLKFKKLKENAIIPTKAYPTDSGFDLYSIEETTILPSDVKMVDTGIAIGLPVGCEGQVRPRSGMAAKNSMTVLNAPGTVDFGFSNSIRVILINHGKNLYQVKIGDRIAQLVINQLPEIETEVVDELPPSDRNLKGWGSSGR